MSVARTVYCFGIPPLIVGTLERMPTPGTSESSPLRVAAVTPGDFESAVLLAANLADGADTVAAVTGQLAGALYGLSGIPDRWLDRLAWKDRLVEAGERLQRASLR